MSDKHANPGDAVDADAVRRFRRLVIVTAVASFLLVILGGVVRVVDAGLGCGPEAAGLSGWPLCDGQLVPNVDTHSVVEYSHRILAAIVVVLLLAVLWQTVRQFRDRPALRRWAFGAVLLVFGQAVLGGLTVEYGLHSGFVAAHLGTAMALLAILMVIYSIAGPRRPDPGAGKGLIAVASVACLLLLSTIVAGGVIAGTEKHGTPDGHTITGAHYACGQQFPTCNNEFLPFGRGEMTDIQLTHRVLMFFASLAIATLAVMLLRRRLNGRIPVVILAVLGVQILLGAVNVWADESALLVLAHLTTGSALWMLVAGVLISLLNPGTMPDRERAGPTAPDAGTAAAGASPA
jgi:heme A synthase